MVAILGSIITSTAVAQVENSSASTNAPAQTAPGAQKKRPDRVQLLDKAVTLTDDQKTKVKAIYEDQDKQAKALFEASKGDRKTAFEGIRKLQDETNKKIKELLTTEQQTKFTKFLEESKQHGPKRPAPAQ